MTLPLLPMPQRVIETGLPWQLADAVSITAAGPAAGVKPCVELLTGYLRGPGLTVRQATQPEPNGIRIALAPNGIDDEAYRLVTGRDGCVIEAASPAGIRHGIQLLRQLLPAAWLDPAAPRGPATIPGLVIEDAPAFQWRGALLDPARHLIPVERVRSFLDAMALHRLNRLHFHLTDDQGWRLPVSSRPRLTEVGGWRAQSQRTRDPSDLDGVLHGGHYTAAQLRELVTYAEARGITIVPEVDLPGHTTAALAAYPELGNVDVSGPHAVACTWGVHDSVLNLEQSSLAFCEEVLDAALAISPSPWIHLGGDECPTREWELSPRARARCRDVGIEDVLNAQRWFTAHLATWVRERGRRAVVWDEAADEALPTDVLVMAWRDQRFGIEAATRGHEVVMCPCDRTYFDWLQTDSPLEAPGQPGITTLATAYGFDPRAGVHDHATRARIIGAQGALWAEYLPTPDRLDDMAFPRMSALAERVWCDQPSPYADFAARAHAQLERLAHLGIHGRAHG